MPRGKRKPAPPEPTTAASLIEVVRMALEVTGDDYTNPSGASERLDDSATSDIHCDGALWRVTIKRLRIESVIKGDETDEDSQ